MALSIRQHCHFFIYKIPLFNRTVFSDTYQNHFFCVASALPSDGKDIKSHFSDTGHWSPYCTAEGFCFFFLLESTSRASLWKADEMPWGKQIPHLSHFPHCGAGTSHHRCCFYGMATNHKDAEVDHQGRFPAKQESSVCNQHTRK